MPLFRHREAGLTLVEVMMVVFIIGLASAVAVMTLPERESEGERAVREVRQVLQQIRDRSVLTGEVTGLYPTDTGLRIVSWTGTEWMATPRGDIQLPQDVRVELLPPDVNGRAGRDAPEQIIFNPLGLAEPVRLSVSWRSLSRELTLTPEGDVVDVGWP